MPSPAHGLTQPERVELSSRRLLQAAAELIVEKGWEATTAAEIGRRAGYSRAMVHARYGSKDAILEAFQDVYVARLNPDPEPDATGLQQVLAHFDRVREIHSEDASVTRAMFVSAFEAVKTTSPLRDGVRAQLAGAAVKIEAGLHAGIADGSLRPDIDVDMALRDITGSIFGIAFQWVVLPEDHDLDHEIDCVRARIISTYGS
ncbi:TetR/AcrR family transcriptional regulator [Mycolicibacterium setense]|uniref:TetR family transcriptional regulator n=1 Tax=Mycolicibacterium setense TaxID=431269 RepID=A0ABR4YZX6_9MYCO|nr:TetR/AcrR family transcriptional regulator [Mycolicibacterium setense]KHO21294.1 TetR family transcriptional regulator [Mycolicibacterium setense]KHO27475.1 TetR family transcriptional regulator [Mycolicibacterium setense]MCV7114670.1 TetR/AcrR family transcriptional regulator [Mycolicibacterium setense]OBB16011.1 TetR family transcriptional regulator [Mycolicibacterium setense]